MGAVSKNKEDSPMDSVHVCLYMHVHLEKHVTQRRKGRSILGREDSSVPIFKLERAHVW